MTIRLSQSSLTGTVRTLVAVGTVRLTSMFWAVRIGAPRSGGELRLVARLGGRGGAFSLGTGDLTAFGAGFSAALFAADFVAGFGAAFSAGLRGGLLPRASARASRRPCRLGFSAGFCAGFAGRGLRAFGRAFAVAFWAASRLLATRLEELPPGAVDAVGVLLVALVHLVDEPLVGAEVRHRVRSRAGLVVLDRLGHVWVRLFRCVW